VAHGPRSCSRYRVWGIGEVFPALSFYGPRCLQDRDVSRSITQTVDLSSVTTDGTILKSLDRMASLSSRKVKIEGNELFLSNSNVANPVKYATAVSRMPGVLLQRGRIAGGGPLSRILWTKDPTTRTMSRTSHLLVLSLLAFSCRTSHGADQIPIIVERDVAGERCAMAKFLRADIYRPMPSGNSPFILQRRYIR